MTLAVHEFLALLAATFTAGIFIGYCSAAMTHARHHHYRTHKKGHR